MGEGLAPHDYLKRLGEQAETSVDIAECALMFAALDHPERPLGSYRAHLSDIAERARDQAAVAREPEAAGRGLIQVLAGHFGYEGDRIRYDDPQNADLMAVMDRRRGLPVALGILYIHAARAAGYAAQGLYAPGHFLLAVNVKKRDVLIDPFCGGAALDHEKLLSPPSLVDPATAADPRALLPVTDIDVLLRLQFNIKMRAQGAGEVPRAAAIAERMLLIAPGRAQLWFDYAKLKEELGTHGAARAGFEKCLTLVKAGEPLHNEVQLALSALKRRLN
jgi:regulator of sirC expression with transglutaminase-like and TPR domain